MVERSFTREQLAQQNTKKRSEEVMRMWAAELGRDDVDVLWMRYVGSEDLSEGEEIRVLNELRRVFGRKKIWHLNLLYMRSKYWKRVKKDIIERDGFQCVKCHAAYELNVDHLKYPKLFGEEVAEWLQTLCVRCHSEKTRRFDLYARWSSKAVVVDVLGDMQLFAALRWRGSHGEAVRKGAVGADKDVALKAEKQGAS